MKKAPKYLYLKIIKQIKNTKTSTYKTSKRFNRQIKTIQETYPIKNRVIIIW